MPTLIKQITKMNEKPKVLEVVLNYPPVPLEPVRYLNNELTLHNI